MTAKARETYHHGDLRRALVAAALDLVRERGAKSVSVREAARRAGVSPGAPFRHFPSRTALLTAVAEDAMDGLAASIDSQLREAKGKPALTRYRAVGVGFLRWAVDNAAHFEVISDRSTIDFEGSALAARHRAVREAMEALLDEAAAAGELRDARSPREVAVAGRALAYGLARMRADGQFPSWGLDDADPLDSCLTLLDRFIEAIAAEPRGLTS